MSRTTRLVLAALVYAAAVAGVFAAAWSTDGGDDYAGWAPTVAALTLPAWLSIARVRGALGRGSAACLAIPAGLSLGGVALLTLWPLSRVVRLEGFSILLAVVVLGPAAVVAIVAVLWRSLVGVPVRDGARRVVQIVAALGAVALTLASPLWWGFWTRAGIDESISVALFLAGSIPLGWALAPALALAATDDT